ncbi:unnamed protein product [Bemisia tabaci]|uniref:C2H2-type domain-containing protein n=1 Tax=Bemisia tabaci TaxID=7038 RepID=A0A9P0AN14_BEMTA|nr:unnamed protein product [Bemisia tabaci]
MPSCPDCKQNFEPINSLINHIKQFHFRSAYADPINCGDCGKPFSAYPNLRKHFKTCRMKVQLEDPNSLLSDTVHNATVDIVVSQPIVENNQFNAQNVRSSRIGDSSKGTTADPIQMLNKECANFIAYLYSHVSLQRKMIQTVVEGVSEIFSTVRDILVEKLEEHLTDQSMTDLMPFVASL